MIPRATMTRMGHPLVDEVAKKASIAWLDGRAAWCAWFDDALYAISGPGEQDLGELTSGVVVTIFPDGAEKYLNESFWNVND